MIKCMRKWQKLKKSCKSKNRSKTCKIGIKMRPTVNTR